MSELRSVQVGVKVSPDLWKATKMKALERDMTVTQLVEEALSIVITK